MPNPDPLRDRLSLPPHGRGGRVGGAVGGGGGGVPPPQADAGVAEEGCEGGGYVRGGVRSQEGEIFGYFFIFSSYCHFLVIFLFFRVMIISWSFFYIFELWSFL